ncbi:MAG: pyruvate formate lyase family protein [Victivallales bacterium]
MKTKNKDEKTIPGNFTGIKPVCRLSGPTRKLAVRYLSGEFGRNMKDAQFAILPEFYLSMPSLNKQYAEAVRLIAENAPLRILPEEKLAGAATLKEATRHSVPLLTQSYRARSVPDGDWISKHPLAPTPSLLSSVSHTTIDFEKALKIGYKGIRGEIIERLGRNDVDSDADDLLRAMLDCLDAASRWHARYVHELERLLAASSGDLRKNYGQVLSGLINVPENPPRNFREAVQALWMLWDFQRLCGNWSGIGRIDKMLGPYLRRDLDSGAISIDDARELLAHFWIKGCEWISADGKGSGDAQFYQNIVLGGIDEEGRDLTNDVTYLVLDIVEELHISDFPIAVRISQNSPEKLLRRIAEVQRLGGGIIAVYNEDRIIPMLVKFGYPVEEARNFANDGCWELLIPGKTCFGYQPFDALALLQETLGLGPVNRDTVEYPDFETLYAEFKNRLAFQVASLLNSSNRSLHPTPLISMLIDGCVEKARSYYDLGPKYTVQSPHPGGLPDVVNSLLVIKKLVYGTKEFTLRDFAGILRDNWNGSEGLRQRVRKEFEFFGNDSTEADAMMRKVFDDFTDLVAKVPKRLGILRPAGISTFGREGTTYLPTRSAAASGHRKGDILAPNFSVTPGTDMKGPTAIIKSHCSVDFSKLPCGTALDLKVLPSSAQGGHGLAALVSMMRTFVSLGGIFMQVDVVDTELLRDAQEHPEKYPNLAVRISGWSARFATLSKEWQDMVIKRSEVKL